MKTTTLSHHYCYTTILCISITITILSFSTIPVNSLDTITATESLTDSQTIVSSNGVFELGFFDPGNSKWYVGIWYKNIPDKTAVWVANRDSSLTNSSGALFRIGDRGNIVILDQSSDVIWSSNQTDAVSPVAQLLDSGNFVLRQDVDKSENYLWQSFDYPTDTLLPGMKLGWDLKRGLNRYLTSWTSTRDPSTGPYSFKLDPHGFPEIFLWNKQVIVYRSGPWNGLRFSGVPEMKPSTVLNFSFVTNQDEVYYSYATKKGSGSVISRLIMSPSGILQRFTWIETTRLWNPFWFAPKDQCDEYRECGVYGVCDTNDSPVCTCLRGFEPKNPLAWNLRDGSDGCVRKSDLDCAKEYGFLALKNVKLPETSTAFVDMSMSLEECEVMCRKNCSCTACANSEITGGGTGCVIWTGVLMDIREYAEGGQNLYVRLAASELAQGGGGTGSDDDSNKTKKIIIIAGIAFGIASLLCGLIIYFVWRKKRFQNICQGSTDPKAPHERSRDLLLSGGFIPRSNREFSDESNTDELELPLFDFGTIAKATDNFSDANKLGQGGFGCVYKGMLSGGQEIAAKRLSKNSGQGTDEFLNEVKLIARLQHRNLVRLLGCSIDMDEKMLIYELATCQLSMQWKGGIRQSRMSSALGSCY